MCTYTEPRTFHIWAPTRAFLRVHTSQRCRDNCAHGTPTGTTSTLHSDAVCKFRRPPYSHDDIMNKEGHKEELSSTL